MPLTNPFKGMSRPAKIATVIGGTAAVGYAVYARHKVTGAWNPFSAGNATASDNATPDASSASVTPADTTGTDLGANAGGGTGALLPTGSSQDLSGTSQVTGTYGNSAAWAQAAQAGLTSIGYDPTTVAAALGVYINQGLLTAAQESIVQVAVAEYGKPDGPNGLPLQILTQPAVQPITHTGELSAPGNVSVTPGKGYADIGWAPVANATAYQVRVEGPQTVTQSLGKATATRVNLKPGNYHVNVRAGTDVGNYHGAYSASKTFTVAANPAHLVSK